MWLQPREFRTLKRGVRRVLKGWEKVSRLEIQRKDDLEQKESLETLLERGIQVRGVAISCFNDIICNNFII